MSNGVIYTIDFAAAIARLEEGTVKGAKAVRKMADEMESASSFARNALATIGIGLSGAAFAAGVKSAAEAADAAAKMGDRFGIATEQMIGMQHAANLAGVSNEGLTTALRGLAKGGVDAASGNEQAREAFARLGVQASEFIKLPMAEQMSLVIDRLGGMENAAVRNATAQALMGRNAGEMMGLVAEGSEAFKKAAADTEAWGLAINRVDAAKIEMANDAIKRAEAATKGVFTQISLALSPAVIALANHFADTKAEAEGYRKEIASGSEFVIQAVGYTMNVVQGLRFAYVGVKLAIAEVLDVTVQWLAELSDFGQSGFVKALSMIPGPTAAVGIALRELGRGGREALDDFAESTSRNVEEIRAELEALAEEGLPADRIIEGIRRVQATIDEEAKKVAERRAALLKTGEAPVLEKDQDQGLSQRISKIMEGNKLELDLLHQHYADRQYDLDLALEKEYITQDFWEGQSALLGASYEVARTKLLDEETKKRYGISQVYRQLDMSSAGAFFGYMGAMMSSHNRVAFEIGKAAAISGAIIDTYKAATGAYAALAHIPYVGPYLGAAAAAAAIVAGLANVQRIRSTAFGGGVGGGATPVYSANPVTGVPTGSIGAPPPPTAFVQGQAAAAATNVHIFFEGGTDRTYSYQEVADELIPLINEAIGNGINITVATT